MVSGKRLRLFLSSIFLVILTFHSLQMFAGNSDRYTVQINYLEPAIEAQYIKIVPNEWRNQISLRLELYGCSEGRKSRIGIVLHIRICHAAVCSFKEDKAVINRGQNNNYSVRSAGELWRFIVAQVLSDSRGRPERLAS